MWVTILKLFLMAGSEMPAVFALFDKMRAEGRTEPTAQEIIDLNEAETDRRAADAEYDASRPKKA